LVRNSQGPAGSFKERIIPSRSRVLHPSAKSCRPHEAPGDAVVLRVSRFRVVLGSPAERRVVADVR
jgi:hypothetical protein